MSHNPGDSCLRGRRMGGAPVAGRSLESGGAPLQRRAQPERAFRPALPRPGPPAASRVGGTGAAQTRAHALGLCLPGRQDVRLRRQMDLVLLSGGPQSGKERSARDGRFSGAAGIPSRQAEFPARVWPVDDCLKRPGHSHRSFAQNR